MSIWRIRIQSLNHSVIKKTIKIYLITATFFKEMNQTKKWFDAIWNSQIENIVKFACLGQSRVDCANSNLIMQMIK